MTMTVEGSTRKWSNWHATKREAFDHLLEKITGSKNTERDCVVPALSQHSSDVSGVSIVHQIYVVFRDGKEMSDLFKLSSKPCQAHCRRNNIRYILWSADHLDWLILTYAPPFVVALYKKVRYVVQRVDIGRFFRALRVWRTVCGSGCSPEPGKLSAGHSRSLQDGIKG